MNRVLERASHFFALISGLVVVVMMVMITVDAIGRKFGYPVPGGLELSEAMMALVIYLALMGVQYHRENVFISIATEPASERTKAVLDAIGSLLGLGLFAVFAWYSWLKALDAYELGEFRVATVDVPIWPFRFAVPIGLALLCVQLAVSAIQDLRGARPKRGEHLLEV